MNDNELVEILGSLNPDELKIMEKYKSNNNDGKLYCDEINWSLRNDATKKIPISDDFLLDIKQIDEIIKKFKSNEYLLYRGTSEECLLPFLDNQDIYRNPEFLSTTLVKNLRRFLVNPSPVIVEFKMPTDSNIFPFYLDKRLDNEEKEVLLPRNLTFKLTSKSILLEKDQIKKALQEYSAYDPLPPDKLSIYKFEIM
ncbi:ADP-ribosyltransferase [Flavobacterium filum]|uniref:ADP-ribosyltransferase n=1 Tax=Flavobacterium filum TaxID=370974 RepID=UPI0023F535E2|nr:ADP-ribosyltransferase [Flavobacterium filum]